MKHICFFGDGVTQGLGDRHHMGWPERLAMLERTMRASAQGACALDDAPALVPYNLSVPWDTSADIALRWQAEASARLQDHTQAGVVFNFGHGDMVDIDDDGVQVPLWDAAAYAESLICEASLLWPVLWIGPTPVAGSGGFYQSGQRTYHLTCGRVQAINDAYGDIACRKGIPYLNLLALLDANPAWQEAMRGGTGLFPSAAGHQAVAEIIHQWQPWRRWMDQGMGGGVALRLRDLPPHTLLTPKMVAAGY